MASIANPAAASRFFRRGRHLLVLLALGAAVAGCWRYPLGDVGLPTPINESEAQVLRTLLAEQPVASCINVGPGALRRAVGHTNLEVTAEYFFPCGAGASAQWYSVSDVMPVTACVEPQCTEMWLKPYLF